MVRFILMDIIKLILFTFGKGGSDVSIIWPMKFENSIPAEPSRIRFSTCSISDFVLKNSL